MKNKLLISLKDSFTKIDKQERVAKIKNILTQNDVDEEDLREFFGINSNVSIPYESLVFILACEKLCDFLSTGRQTITINKTDLIVRDEYDKSYDYNHCLELLKSNNPPSSMSEMIMLTGINKLKLMMYINTDPLFNTWFTVINNVKTAEILENVQEQALKEDFATASGKEGHKYKASEISLNFMNKDFMKRNASNSVKEIEDDLGKILNSLNGAENGSNQENNIIEIENFDIKNN